MANFNDQYDLTFSIGGPSVNALSADMLKREFPDFRIDYREHIAHYCTTTFEPGVDPQSREIVDDYGFIFRCSTHAGQTAFVLCGVHAPGTEIATKCLLGLRRSSEAARLIRAGKKVFIVSTAVLNGLRQGSWMVTETREVRP
jgi:hypothetical protein